MKLKVSRTDTGRWMSGNSIYFRAVDDAGGDVVVELSQSDWNTIKGRYDPLTGLEEAAMKGRWVPFGAARLWRVELS